MQHVLHKHLQSSYYFDDEEPINKKRLISSRVISISVTLNGDIIQGRANIDPSYDVEKKSRMIETLSIRYEYNNNSIFKSNETFFASIIKQDGRSISKYDTLLPKSVETLYDKFSYFFFLNMSSRKKKIKLKSRRHRIYRVIKKGREKIF